MKIEGYFTGIKAANEAAEKLKSQGFKGAFTDINDHDNNAYMKNGLVGSRDISTLSQAVLGEENSSPLAAASPMASGMGGFEEIADMNYKVVVETSDENIENAKNIIRSMDGTTNDPNPRMPKEIDNINEDALILGNLKD